MIYNKVFIVDILLCSSTFVLGKNADKGYRIVSDIYSRETITYKK